ncbi:hypothetical protein D6851_03400 [Altericroceibacterium spongiae]|uniref:Tetratricopeptide repeat protein n=1 Tax=Altericroceibacterium spongiae TaxID=2320269 RepID=A0A420ES63_9SPHN|nr:hypothetical protein [Altericroceibacterium spongiae]RKF23518.1 hypothetical protein D6851_03400 [Altericroceibacterium spongiae]
MLRTSLPARRTRFGSKFALAVALASGTVIGATGIATPAYAQKQDYSKGFVEAYAPVADAVNAEGADIEAQKANIPAIVSAVKTEDDRFAAGQLILSMGSKSKDPALQRQGLEMMLQSGKVPAEQVGQFQFFVGNLAYQEKDYEAARTALKAAADAGYTENDPQGLIIESYFAEGKNAEGVSYLENVVKQRQAAGQQVPDNWLLRGLKVAYENSLADESVTLSSLLVKNTPTQQNWVNGLQVVRATHDWDDPASLDFLRLMRATNTLTTQRDYIDYIEAADARMLPNEVLSLVNEGIEAGVVPADETYFSEAKSIAQDRAEDDREATMDLVDEANSAADGVTARGAADSFMSFDDYANAEKMYQVALQKGGVDNERVLTRLGIVQIKQGKYDEGKATLAKVTGPRKAIAEMWSTYADVEANGGVQAVPAQAPAQQPAAAPAAETPAETSN